MSPHLYAGSDGFLFLGRTRRGLCDQLTSLGGRLLSHVIGRGRLGRGVCISTGKYQADFTICYFLGWYRYYFFLSALMKTYKYYYTSLPPPVSSLMQHKIVILGMSTLYSLCYYLYQIYLTMWRRCLLKLLYSLIIVHSGTLSHGANILHITGYVLFKWLR